MSAKTEKLPHSIAFRHAQTLVSNAARDMAVSLLRDDENPSTSTNQLRKVRRALADAWVASGVNYDDPTDYDGDRFRDRELGKDADADEFWYQMSLREEAGYLYGLALGLLLGRGGAR